MIEIVKELNIEVSKPNIFQAVVAKQYDMNTRFIKATFVDGADKILINPLATLTVVINAERPDGTSKGFDGVVNEDGTVTVPLHSWMLELAGTVVCDISVINTATDNNKKLTTTSFTLLVEKAAYGGDDLTTDPQYDILVELIKKVEDMNCSAIGQPTEENGEVFNDYENNKAINEYSHAEGVDVLAGVKGFLINNIEFSKEPPFTSTEEDPATITMFLDSVEGLYFGDKVSFRMYGNISPTPWLRYHADIGKIDAVNEGSNSIRIVVDPNRTIEYAFKPPDSESPKPGQMSYLWVASKPEIGTHDWASSQHAEGVSTKSFETAGHTEGYGTIVNGPYGHAEGRETTAEYSCHAEGRGTKAYGEQCHAEGSNTQAIGYNCHAEGSNTLALRQNSHAEGSSTKARALYAHAEGWGSIADGSASHSEGQETLAEGSCSHAEGIKTKAKGTCSHTEGNGTTASATNSHAGGSESVAGSTGDFVHGIGLLTESSGYASEQYRAVFGRYNKYVADAVLTVGNGGFGTRDNALVVHKDGSAELGKIGNTDNSVVLKKELNAALKLIADLTARVEALENK